MKKIIIIMLGVMSLGSINCQASTLYKYDKSVAQKQTWKFKAMPNNKSIQRICIDGHNDTVRLMRKFLNTK